MNTATQQVLEDYLGRKPTEAELINASNDPNIQTAVKRVLRDSLVSRVDAATSLDDIKKLLKEFLKI